MRILCVFWSCFSYFYHHLLFYFLFNSQFHNRILCIKLLTLWVNPIKTLARLYPRCTKQWNTILQCCKLVANEFPCALNAYLEITYVWTPPSSAKNSRRANFTKLITILGLNSNGTTGNTVGFRSCQRASRNICK